MNTALVIAPSGDPSMSHAQAASALLAEWLGDDQQANATSSFSARARAAQKVVAALRETTAKLREQQQQQQQNREDAATTTILKIFIKNIKTCTPTAPLTPLQDVVMNQVAILVKTLLLEQADYSASEEVLPMLRLVTPPTQSAQNQHLVKYLLKIPKLKLILNEQVPK